MKKIILTLFIIVFSISISGYSLINKNTKNFSCELYLVDNSMLRLIPIDYKIENTTLKEACNALVEELITGGKYKNKTLRVIPNIDNGMKVNISKNTAHIKLSNKFIANIPKNNLHGVLMIYSIVNTITSLKGIDTVKFDLPEAYDDFYIGGIDMNEIFIPDFSF